MPREAMPQDPRSAHPARAILACVLTIALQMMSVPARSDIILPGLDQPALRGEARLSVLGFGIHDARLFTPRGEAHVPGRPVALQLTYLRAFSAAQLNGTTRKELERIFGRSQTTGTDAARLAGCFRDVGPGDSFVAISRNSNDLRLHLNGVQTCRLDDPGLASRFLAIWLSDRSRYPDMSRRLRGLR